MIQDNSVSEGYLLRITKNKWVKQVFERTKYYPGIRRKWKQGTIIFFAHKTEKGDSIIGYGVVEKFQEKNELTLQERIECEKMGWKGAIDFRYVIKFDQPLPIKESALKDLKLRGKYLHGFHLNRARLESLLNQAERMLPH
jgi:hypothetical protein